MKFRKCSLKASVLVILLMCTVLVACRDKNNYEFVTDLTLTSDVISSDFDGTVWGQYMLDGVLFTLSTARNNPKNYEGIEREWYRYRMYVCATKSLTDTSEVTLNSVSVEGITTKKFDNLYKEIYRQFEFKEKHIIVKEHLEDDGMEVFDELSERNMKGNSDEIYKITLNVTVSNESTTTTDDIVIIGYLGDHTFYPIYNYDE